MATKKKVEQVADVVNPEEEAAPPPRVMAKAKSPETLKARPGYVLCTVACDGQVIALGFKNGEQKDVFNNGDKAEFSEKDVESLPEILLPVA